MTDERRLYARVKVNLSARWKGVLTQQDATVVDLSQAGCFMLSGGKVEPNELIRLEITLPNDEPIYPWAEVVEETDGIGFSVLFTSMSDEELDRLDQFVKQALAASS